jgi:hypothetical protein
MDFIHYTIPIYVEFWPMTSNYGQTFGGGYDMNVNGSNVTLRPRNSYDPGPLPNGVFPIKEMEVFRVTNLPNPSRNALSKENQTKHATQAVEEVIRFSDDMNKAINAKQAYLLQA